jgi:hypothetical protein
MRGREAHSKNFDISKHGAWTLDGAQCLQGRAHVALYWMEVRVWRGYNESADWSELYGRVL